MRILFLVLFMLIGATTARASGLPDATSFSAAMERGDLPLAREWLDGGLSPDFEGRVIGTGVMIGAWEGNIPLMDLFVSRGADINKANSIGEQALLHAAWKGHLNAVRWLVEHGARLNRNGKEWAALHYAAFAGHQDVVAFLLERGADINALSTNGSTPLMMAAREGKEDIARRLLAAGARTDIVNERGDDAVRFAMRYNNLDLARDIGGSQNFAAAVARPVASWGRAVRSQAVPDRADQLLAQARKMEAAGRRDEALKLYRAALSAIHKAESVANKASAPGRGRTATGLVVSAQRSKPGAQTAILNYSTPAGRIGPKDAAPGQQAGGTSAAAPDAADDWLRRARELEAAGRRNEAMQAYRQASAVLRGARPASLPAPLPQ